MAFVAAASIFFFFVLTQWRQIQVAAQEMEAAEQQLARVKDLVSVVSDLSATFGDLEKEAGRIRNALPSEQNAQLPELLVQIAALASQNGLVLQQINFGVGSENRGLYTAVEITLQVVGDYEALKTFLVAIEQNLRIIDVSRLNFGVAREGEENQAIQFNLALTTYYQ